MNLKVNANQTRMCMNSFQNQINALLNQQDTLESENERLKKRLSIKNDDLLLRITNNLPKVFTDNFLMSLHRQNLHLKSVGDIAMSDTFCQQYDETCSRQSQADNLSIKSIISIYREKLKKAETQIVELGEYVKQQDNLITQIKKSLKNKGVIVDILQEQLRIAKEKIRIQNPQFNQVLFQQSECCDNKTTKNTEEYITQTRDNEYVERCIPSEILQQNQNFKNKIKIIPSVTSQSLNDFSKYSVRNPSTINESFQVEKYVPYNRRGQINISNYNDSISQSQYNLTKIQSLKDKNENQFNIPSVPYFINSNDLNQLETPQLIRINQQDLNHQSNQNISNTKISPICQLQTPFSINYSSSFNSKPSSNFQNSIQSQSSIFNSQLGQGDQSNQQVLSDSLQNVCSSMNKKKVMKYSKSNNSLPRSQMEGDSNQNVIVNQKLTKKFSSNCHNGQQSKETEQNMQINLQKYQDHQNSNKFQFESIEKTFLYSKNPDNESSKKCNQSELICALNNNLAPNMSFIESNSIKAAVSTEEQVCMKARMQVQSKMITSSLVLRNKVTPDKGEDILCEKNMQCINKLDEDQKIERQSLSFHSNMIYTTADQPDRFLNGRRRSRAERLQRSNSSGLIYSSYSNIANSIQ